MILETVAIVISYIMGVVSGWLLLTYLTERNYHKTIKNLKAKGYKITEGINPDSGNPTLTVALKEEDTLNLKDDRILH